MDEDETSDLEMGQGPGDRLVDHFKRSGELLQERETCKKQKNASVKVSE
jgi:hypothetical protein